METIRQGHIFSINVFSRSTLLLACLILLLFSGLTIFSAVGTYKISIEGSKNLLETKAVDKAVTLGFDLERYGLKEKIFTDLMNTDELDELAYLALYDIEGTVLLHSNPRLVGRSVPDPHISRVISGMKAESRFSTLATGEDVFLLDFPVILHLRDNGEEEASDEREALRNSHDEEPPPRAGAKVYCLRVSLHPYPARSIVRKANFQLLLICLSLVTLWLLTFFFLWQWRRTARLEVRLQEQERMAALGQMAAVMAHEIRNPLSSIKGFAQYRLERTDDPEVREDLGVIVDESRRLESLTKNLLTYAKEIRLNKEEFTLEDFCTELQRSTIIPDDMASVSYSHDEATVYFDREKLMQVAVNLLQNAIDAVAEKSGGRVLFSARMHDDILILTVEDNGPGVSSEMKERLFEPFATSKVRGTGLGLAIVKRLVEAMGGEVSLRNGKEGGTVAEVRIGRT